MKRYLLFDGGCAVCNQIAQAIEEAASGKLQVVSLRDPQAVQWLEQVYPEGWAHQPYLVTVDGDRVQAYAGPGMAMRLGWLLGPRKAWRVWSLARRYGVMLPPGGEYSAERRGFLKGVPVLMAALIATSWLRPLGLGSDLPSTQGVTPLADDPGGGGGGCDPNQCCTVRIERVCYPNSCGGETCYCRRCYYNDCGQLQDCGSWYKCSETCLTEVDPET